MKNSNKMSFLSSILIFTIDAHMFLKEMGKNWFKYQMFLLIRVTSSVCGNIEENKQNQMQWKVICEATNTLTFFLSYDKEENSGNPLIIVSNTSNGSINTYAWPIFFMYSVSCILIDMRLCL